MKIFSCVIDWWTEFNTLYQKSDINAFANNEGIVFNNVLCRPPSCGLEIDRKSNLLNLRNRNWGYRVRSLPHTMYFWILFILYGRSMMLLLIYWGKHITIGKKQTNKLQHKIFLFPTLQWIRFIYLSFGQLLHFHPYF